MERKNEIRVSFETINLSQVFIHTAGSYMCKPISKNNNKYLANLRTLKFFLPFNISKASSV